MQKELKKTAIVLYFGQFVFMVCGLVCLICGYKDGKNLYYFLAGGFVYGSMFFYGLKIHLGRLITKDFETQTKKSIKLWTDLNRRGRRKSEKKIRKELRKIKK